MSGKAESPPGWGIPPSGASGEGGHAAWLSSHDLLAAGETAFEFIVNSQAWVDRRVERIEFLDDQVARRALTVDLRLPAKLEPVPSADKPQGKPVSAYLLPIAMRAKSPPSPQRSSTGPLEARDELGARLSVLNRQQSAPIAAQALTTAAQKALPGRLPEYLLRLIGHITFLEPHRAVPAVAALTSPKSTAWRKLRLPKGVADVRAQLHRDPHFVNLVSWLAVSSPVLAPISPRTNERCTVKLSWSEYVGVDASAHSGPEGTQRAPLRGRNRWGARLGLRSTVVSVSMPLLGGTASQHIEVEAPPEVNVARMRLRARDPHRILPEAPRLSPDHGGEYSVTRPGQQQRAHIHMPDAGVPRFGNLRVELRAARHGYAVGGLIAAGLIFATLWFFVVAADSLADRTTPAASILLLLPGLLVAYVVRPGEHLMSRKLRGPMRACLAFDGFLVLVAAGAYAALAPSTVEASSAGAPSALLAFWFACALLSTGVLALLILGWRSSRPAGEA